MSRLRYWLFCALLSLFYATGWAWVVRVAARLPSPDWFGHEEET